MAIVADHFVLQQRGKVMGFVQMGFGVSQVLGIPIGLYFANAYGWQVPFWGIAVLAGLLSLLLFVKLKPIAGHLHLQQSRSPVRHLFHTVSQKNYRIGFLATALLSIGGFMMMPFGSAFAINNLKLTPEQLPFLFMASGVATLVSMPIIGKLSDRIDKFKLFTAATLSAVVVINVYAHLSNTPFGLVLLTNILMMMTIMSRMVPSTALTSAIPAPEDRGAFMSINSSLQQMAGGFGAMLAGVIIVQKDNFSPLEHFDTLAMIATGIMVVTIALVYRVDVIIKNRAR